MKQLLVAAVLLMGVIGVAAWQQSGYTTSTNIRLDGNGAQFSRQLNIAGTTDPCANPDVAKSSAKVSVTGTTAVELVATSGTTKVYVCSGAFTIQGSATSVGTLQFETGTKVTNPCDTSTSTVTGAFAGNINASVPTAVTLGATATQFASTAGGEMCVVSTGTTISVQGYISYVQQ